LLPIGPAHVAASLPVVLVALVAMAAVAVGGYLLVKRKSTQ
jgi:hypothetical protein